MAWWESEDKWFDCYEALELDESANEDDLKNAYRKLAKKYHPDYKDGDKEKFEQVKLAYDTLKDPKTRESYTTFSKKYKKSPESDNHKDTEEEQLSFEDVVKIYKEKEKQIKIYVNYMLYRVEQKEEKFSAIYNSFCQALKEKKLSKDDFEIRRQKLRSLELANINKIKEIEGIINGDLKNMNFSFEKKRLKTLKTKFKAVDSILTSEYKVAIAKLNKKTFKGKRKLSYVAMIPIGIILTSLYLSNFTHKGKEAEEPEALEAPVLPVEDTNFLIEEALSEPNDDLIKVEPFEGEKFEVLPHCILFESVPDDMEYDEISDIPYKMGPYEVVNTRKDGIGYIIDTSSNQVIISNYLSHGPAIYENGQRVYCFLSADGYDFYLDASDLRTIVKVESAYSEESEPFYLEGYGYVIEAQCCGENYLIDAETRYPLVTWYDDYGPMYYDEELGCNVYCFTKYGDDLYYLAADDLTKVLKIEENN